MFSRYVSDLPEKEGNLALGIEGSGSSKVLLGRLEA